MPRRARRSGLRADLLQMGHDLLLPWDMAALGAAGLGCEAACGMFLDGTAPGLLHNQVLLLSWLGPILAPFVMRDEGVAAGSSAMLARAFRRAVLLMAVLAGVGLVIHGVEKARLIWMAVWLASTVGVVMGGRLLYVQAVRAVARRGVGLDRIAVVGNGSSAQWLHHRILSAHSPGLQVVGVYQPHFDTKADLDLLVDDLLGMVRRGELDRIALALPGADGARTLQLAHRLKQLEIEVTSLYAPPGQGPFAETEIAGVRLVVMNARPQRSWNAVAKSVGDRALAGLLLLWLAPLLALIALAVRLGSPGPVIFRQQRHGRNGTQFDVLKFRTMTWQGQGAGDGAQQTRRGDRRVTAVGAILRTTSLDELPQLFNVLNGTMSLVGPRPHPVVMRTEERLGDEIIAEYAHRHRVKPGITGWAQINGYRGATETAEQLRKRVEFDIQYIDNWSLLFDLRILLLTPLKVLFQRNNAF